MKLTVITNQSGDILGTVRGHEKDIQFSGLKGGIVVSGDQQFQEINVPDEYEQMDAGELHKSVAAHLKKK